MVKIYIAGIESSLDVVYKVKLPYVLFSYFIIRKSQEKLITWIKKIKEYGATIFLDSGAHSVQVRKDIEVDYDQYLQDYISFIKKYRKYIDYWVELDIDNKVGTKKVWLYRMKILDELGDVIPVWHPERGIKEWKLLCENFKYIGTQTVIKGLSPHYLLKLIKYANKKGVKVHGFGYSKFNSKLYQVILKNFYSVDSSTFYKSSYFRKRIVQGSKKLYHSKLKEYSFIHFKKMTEVNLHEFKEIVRRWDS